MYKTSFNLVQDIINYYWLSHWSVLTANTWLWITLVNDSKTQHSLKMNNFLATKLQHFYNPFTNLSSNQNGNLSNNDQTLEYDKNDSLVTREESLQRIFWIIWSLACLLSCTLQLFVIITASMSTSTEIQLLQHLENENMLRPKLQILHHNGWVDICDLEIISKFSSISKVPLYIVFYHLLRKNCWDNYQEISYLCKSFFSQRAWLFLFIKVWWPNILLSWKNSRFLL